MRRSYPALVAATLTAVASAQQPSQGPGTSPSNPVWDGAYRRITVKVNRPNASPDHIHDIKLKLKASIERGEGAEGDAAIELTIDISRLAFKPVDGNQEAEVSVTVFGADRGGNSTGGYWKRTKITIPTDLHKHGLREGWFYAVRVPMKNNTQRIKVVAYDYDADVIGTAETKFY